MRDYYVNTCQTFKIRAHDALFDRVFQLSATIDIVVFTTANNAKHYSFDGVSKITIATLVIRSSRLVIP